MQTVVRSHFNMRHTFVGALPPWALCEGNLVVLCVLCVRVCRHIKALFLL